MDLFQRTQAFIDSRGASEPFDPLAADVVTSQLAWIPAWSRLQGDVQGRVDPGCVRPFPAELYKREPLGGGPPPAQTFETSGTGSGHPGRVGYSREDLALMDRAIRRNAERFLFPDGPGGTRVLVLAPSPQVRPAMIMAHGMERLIDAFSAEGGRFLFAAQGPDVPALVAELEAASRHGRPLTLVGASFGFVHLMDAFAERGLAFRLPAGSRLMDAGGTKGRSREQSRTEFRSRVQACFGIDADWQTNLLGMTELGSQFYDHAVGCAASASPRKSNPPWTRTWAVDPETLACQPEGRLGLLVHLDLANLHHPAFVLTQDVGRCFADGFEITGRARGAETRGCSVAMDEFLSSQTAS